MQNMTINALYDAIKNKMIVRLPFFNGFCTVYVKADVKDMLGELENVMANDGGNRKVRVKIVHDKNIYMEDNQSRKILSND